MRWIPGLSVLRRQTDDDLLDYNPSSRREKHRIDLRGLHAQEALKYCDDALRELQESGSGNVLSVMIGRGKNTDGVGKGKVKPTLKQFAKA